MPKSTQRCSLNMSHSSKESGSRSSSIRSRAVSFAFLVLAVDTLLAATKAGRFALLFQLVDDVVHLQPPVNDSGVFFQPRWPSSREAAAEGVVWPASTAACKPGRSC